MDILFIIGDSRSGSSLLQYLFALQHDVIALGEVRRLEQIVKSGEPCHCGRSIDLCPFWTKVASNLNLRLDKIKTIPALSLWRRRFGQVVIWLALRYKLELFARRLLVHERRAVAHCLGLYHAATKLTGKRVVVDSSKVPSHFLYLYLERKELFHPVFLVRDGRGVVWSKMKRGVSAVLSSKQWLNAMKMMLAVQQVISFPKSSFVRYEELCKNPTEILENILKPLNVPVSSINLRNLPRESHELGGSPRFFGNRSFMIELDELWRYEMPNDALTTFEKIAGSVNRKLGYF